MRGKEGIVTDYFVLFPLLRKFQMYSDLVKTVLEPLMYPSLTSMLWTILLHLFPPHGTLAILKQISEWHHI